MKSIKCLLLSLLCVCFMQAHAAKISSIVIFGDSLSDNGNVTHLLKSLREEEDPKFLIEPLEHYIDRIIDEDAHKNHIPKHLADLGKKIVDGIFDDVFAPLLAKFVSAAQKIPVIPQSPYWHYHFSNGPVWNEYFANRIGVSLDNKKQFDNRALGGSWAVTTDNHLKLWNLIRFPKKTLQNIVKGKLLPSSLGLVVQAYLMDKGRANPKTTYFIFSGGNDYLNALNFGDNRQQKNMNQYVNHVVDGIVHAAKSLLDKGARHIVIFGVPDVAVTPHFKKSPYKTLLSKATSKHNHDLKNVVLSLSHHYKQAKVSFVDIQALLQEVIDTPEIYGIKNVTDACIDKPIPTVNNAKPYFHNNIVLNLAVTRSQGVYHQCDKADEYLFWDEIHPTSKVHQYLSQKVCLHLQQEGYEDLPC